MSAALAAYSLGDYFSLVATAVGTLGAGLVIAAAVCAWYRRTLGRRRDRYARIARLGPGAQLSFFISVLGEPPAIRRTIETMATEWVGPGDPLFDSTKAKPDFEGHLVEVPARYTESVFIDRDFYVQVLSDTDETVLGFSVTTRSKRFAPTFTGVPQPSLLVRLREQLEGRLNQVRRKPSEGALDGAEDNMGDEGEAFADEELGDEDAVDEEEDAVDEEEDAVDEEEDAVDEEESDDPDPPDDRYQPLFKVQLGRTKFSDISRRDYAPDSVIGDVWPRGFSYSEMHYFGNPGFYLHYVFTASILASWAPVGSFDFADGRLFRWPPDESDESPQDEADLCERPTWRTLDQVHRFRRESVITTYSVFGNLSIDDYPIGFGPHGDEVRTLP